MKGDKAADKETTLIAVVHPGCKQNTGDTESSVSKRQSNLIAGFIVRAMVYRTSQVLLQSTLALSSTNLQAETPSSGIYFAHFQRCVTTSPATPQL